MTIPLKKSREIIFQIIYSLDLNEHVEPQSFLFILDELLVTRKVLYQSFIKAKEIFKKIEELDVLIAPHCKDYDLKRISPVERNILRLAVFEFMFEKSTPLKVSISEAIRIARKFGTPEAGRFINGVLHPLFQPQEGAC